MIASQSTAGPSRRARGRATTMPMPKPKPSDDAERGAVPARCEEPWSASLPAPPEGTSRARRAPPARACRRSLRHDAVGEALGDLGARVDDRLLDVGGVRACEICRGPGPTVPLAPAAASVWQEPQPLAVKICSPSAALCAAAAGRRRRRRRARLRRPARRAWRSRRRTRLRHHAHELRAWWRGRGRRARRRPPRSRPTRSGVSRILVVRPGHGVRLEAELAAPRRSGSRPSCGS